MNFESLGKHPSFALGGSKRDALRFVLLMLLGAAASAAHACTSVQAGALTSIKIDAWDDTDAGVVVSRWVHTGNANFLSGCTPTATVPINVSAVMPDLEFVQNVVVDGETFPAFGVKGKPNTPLLVFQYVVGNGSGTSLYFPFDVRTTLRFPGTGVSGTHRWTWVRMAAVSRGGAAQALPYTVLGKITYISPDFPRFVKTDDYNVTATLKTKTCTLTDKPVVLKDVNMSELPGVGSSTGERTFDVVMRCNGVFPAFLTLTDANASGNTGSRLTPSRNADAGAVTVELLREGVPVVLGRRWALDATQNGNQNVALSARYYREAGTFHGGVVEGQATITVTYR